MKLPVRFFTLLASLATAAVTIAAEASDTIPPDDGFDPALLFVVLFFAAVLLVLVGIGIAIGLVCLGCLSLFVAFGIVSSAALITIFRGRFSAGLRAFHYQLMAVIALPCGIGALWLGSELFEFHLRHRSILLVGSALGVMAGVCIAFILDRFTRFVYRRIVPASELPLLK